MANRHLSRSIVMQTLFERDSRREISKGNKAEGVAYKEDLDEIIERDAQEFAPGMGDFSFVKGLVQGIIEKEETLDNIIEKAAPDWPINRISIADRNILRIGLYELLFSDYKEVPPKVAINEAIELAKTFGGENSGKFVNGVLGAVYKEMGEPKKDEVGSKKNATPIDISKLPIEKLGGALVYSKYKTGKYIALVHDIFGHWTLPKGHISEDENEEEGTQREIKKELSIDVTVLEKLGENEYIASNPEKGKIRKHVSYFLTETPYQELILEKSGGLDKAQWFKLEDITDLNIYDDILPIITKGIALIAKHSK